MKGLSFYTFNNAKYTTLKLQSLLKEGALVDIGMLTGFKCPMKLTRSSTEEREWVQTENSAVKPKEQEAGSRSAHHIYLSHQL